MSDESAKSASTNQNVALKRTLQLAVSLAIGAGMFWFAFHDLPVEGKDPATTTFSDRLDFLFAQVANVPLAAHVVYPVLVIVQFVFRSERWRIQANGLSRRKVSASESFAINAVAFTSVFLFPFRLGEFVRPVVGERRGIMPASAGLALSMLERIFDGLVTAGFFVGVLFLIGDSAGRLPDWIHQGKYVAFLFFGGPAIAILLAARWREASVAFWRKLLSLIHEKLADRLVGMLEAFLDGLGCFRSRGAVAAYLGYTIAYWTLNGLSMWILLRMMGIDVSVLAAYFCLSFLVIGVMIPAPPGNIGNFHAFAKEALTLMGVAAAPALAFAFVVHAWQVASLLLWAGFWVLRGDVSLRVVAEAASEDALQAGPADAVVAPARDQAPIA